MIFRAELAEKVLAGEKTVTRRVVKDNPRSPWWRERCWYTPGKVFTINPGRGAPNVGHARVVSLEREPLSFLRTCSLLDLESEARKEGFATSGEFWKTFEAINGALPGDTLVWRIEFEVIPSGSVTWDG